MEARSGIGFTPAAGLVVIALPKEAYPSGDIKFPSPAVWRSNVEEKAKSLVNGKLKVAATGEGVTFVKPSDEILVASHVRVQPVDLEVEGSEYPIIFWVIREHEVLVKFDE